MLWEIGRRYFRPAFCINHPPNPTISVDSGLSACEMLALSEWSLNGETRDAAKDKLGSLVPGIVGCVDEYAQPNPRSKEEVRRRRERGRSPDCSLTHSANQFPNREYVTPLRLSLAFFSEGFLMRWHLAGSNCRPPLPSRVVPGGAADDLYSRSESSRSLFAVEESRLSSCRCVAGRQAAECLSDRADDDHLLRGAQLREDGQGQCFA